MSSAQILPEAGDAPGYTGQRYRLVSAHTAYPFLEKCFFHRMVHKVSSKNSVSRRLRVMVCTDKLILQMTETGGVERVIQLEHVQRLRLQVRPGQDPELLILLNHSATTDPDMHFHLLPSTKNVPAESEPSEICQIIRYLVWGCTGRITPIDLLSPTQDIAVGSMKKKPATYAKPDEKLRQWKSNPEGVTSPYRDALKQTFKKNLNPYVDKEEVKVVVRKGDDEQIGMSLTPQLRLVKVQPGSILGRTTGESLVGRYLTHVDGEGYRDHEVVTGKVRGLRECVLTFSKQPFVDQTEVPPTPRQVEQEEPPPYVADMTTVAQQAGSGDINEPLEDDIEEVPERSVAAAAAPPQADLLQQMMLYQLMSQRAQQPRPITLNLKLNFIQEEDSDYGSLGSNSPPQRCFPPAATQHHPYPYPVAAPSLGAPVYLDYNNNNPML